MEIKQHLKYICEALIERKGLDIEVIKIDELTTIADYFVICSATSTTHVRALADSVEFHLKHDHDIMPHHIEGFESSSWILLDYGGVLVHIFLPETRDFYRLENLWKDGQKIEFSTLCVNTNVKYRG